MARKAAEDMADNHPLADIGAIVQITGPKRGRWRAGRYFGATTITIEVAELSADEQIALAEDAALTIVAAPDPAGAPAEASSPT